MAGVGLVESLLTLNMVDEITRTKGESNREANGSGVQPILSMAFSEEWADVLWLLKHLSILERGARTRISAIIGALTILLIILVGGPVIEQIPMAALVGVMTYGGNRNISSGFLLKIVNKMPKSDILSEYW